MATIIGTPGPDTITPSFVSIAGETLPGPWHDSLVGLTGLAPDAATRFSYETDLGRLWLDPDGSGAAARPILVTLPGAPALAAADIIVI